MAYAAVASLSHTIDLILNYHQHFICPQFKDQIISLHKHIIFFESFLEDFPRRANNWEETIREVTDRAEDIIELLFSDLLLESKLTVGSSRSKFEKGKYEVHYSLDELERATEEMESIVNRVKGIHTEAMGGSDDELMKLISRLRGGSSALEIIPIVGVGGTGKTTLATKAYCHQLIQNHFDVLAWSSESTNRSLPDIISDVLRCITFADFSNSEDRLHYGLDELERATEEIESIVNRVKGIHTEAMGGSDETTSAEFSNSVDQLCYELKRATEAMKSIARIHTEAPDKTTFAKFLNSVDELRYVLKCSTEAMKSIVNRIHAEAMGGSDETTSAEFSNSVDQLRYELKSATEAMKCIAYHSKFEAMFSINSEDKLNESLYRSLCGKRFLIVLDDVWYLEALDGLKTMLPDDRNGSRIILTTRSFELARSVGHIHEMSLLDEEKSWNLFREKIFKGDPCPSQLESIGKDIARSCRGHPLSIEVVSGILAADQTEAAWEDVSENLKLASEDGESDLSLKILSQCYRCLPHHLRPCVLYLGIFPKDHVIHVSKLIKLWEAEGFLNQSDECKSFEESGQEFVEDLARRSLVSVCNWKSNGRIKSIKIHDLVRDLCLRQAQTDNFILHVEISNRFPVAGGLKLCRRVSDIIYDDDFLEGVYGSTIRTIMLNYSSALGVQFSIGNVKLLRILDSSNAYLYDLPEEVFELFHLRYLAFHCGFSISEAISNLENLQTLIIRSRGKVFEKFGELPEGIWRMPQLRHLIVFRFKLPSPKGATSPLENLQTLSGVVDFICSRENLKMIPNLKKLAICYSKNSGDLVEDYQLDNLINLQKLEILKIVMNRSYVEERKISTRAFPPTLKKLNLSGVQLPWEDMKIVASLPNLQVLKLISHAFIGETWETSEGGFSQLCYLVIVESNLVNWITESSHFPRLERLSLHRCSSLLEVPNDMGKIPTLESIVLDHKSTHSLLCSAKQIQEDLQSSGDDRLRIQIL